MQGKRSHRQWRRDSKQNKSRIYKSYIFKFRISKLHIFETSIYKFQNGEEHEASWNPNGVEHENLMLAGTRQRSAVATRSGAHHTNSY